MTECSCGAEIVQPRTGRRRRWCSDRCRKAAERRALACPETRDDPELIPTPRVAREPHGVRSFATFDELDAWLRENP